jgi:hypothetical protein
MSWLVMHRCMNLVSLAFGDKFEAEVDTICYFHYL